MNPREAQLFILHSEKARLETSQAQAMLDPNTTTKRTDIDDEILAIGEDIKKLKGNPGIFLGQASHWSTKNGLAIQTEETADTYPIMDADNKQIGHVHRNYGRWYIKIFGRDDVPMVGYNNKDEAFIGAICWLSPLS
jgi:hypothetical protein